MKVNMCVIFQEISIDYGSANTADHHFFSRQFGLSGFWGWAYVGFKFTAKMVASCLLFGAPGGPK